ncbi:MAG: prolyl oligopeptidase family serine peptidase [Candidatus Aminicenantes bacterium]|nr:MAG: prolyl oligopeptidase family serine peptidase [Candidatus Aminicenantes bacterium]
MRIKKFQIILILFSMFFFYLTALPFQNSDELEIVQTDTTIRIDGSLEEWRIVKGLPIHFTPGGKRVDPSSDATVTAKFTFDSENFYAAVKAIDDYFEFPDRSWRYGDGFYLTFIDPSQGSQSNRFYTFGFSRQGELDTKVLVNQDGVYFPGTSIKDVRVEIIPDALQKIITYEIAIPWKYIIPFKPFIQKQWGINLIYVDRDQERREIFQLFPDMNYDTEATNLRKGAIFKFISQLPESPEFQTCLSATHFYHDSEKAITCAVNSPSEQLGWEIYYKLSSGDLIVSSSNNIALEKGINSFRLVIEDEYHLSGLYNLNLKIVDEKGTLRYEEEKEYFVLNKNEFENLHSRLNETKDKELFTSDIIFRESIPILEIRLEWIKQFMEDSPPFSDVDSLAQLYQETNSLFRDISRGMAVLFPPGKIARLAHRSEIDNTLQPYSVFVPESYKKDVPIPLFVSLHGSVVDEKRTIQYVTRVLQNKLKCIILSPKARGLSDWYLGDSGKDVIECINHLKKLYSIDEKNIILDGFSMGGYGAWRLGLQYPDLFKAVIIRSGAVTAPLHLKGFKIIDLLDRGVRLNVFIVHGDMDNAVPVKNTRRVVERLNELGIEHNYIEVKGAAHGGYDKWDEILDWLKNIVIK